MLAYHINDSEVFYPCLCLAIVLFCYSLSRHRDYIAYNIVCLVNRGAVETMLLTPVIKGLSFNF